SEVVDELFRDECRYIVNTVEHLADGDRRRRMPPHQAKSLLELGADGIFEPEEAIRLEILREPRGFDRRAAVMNVVEQVHVVAVRFADGLEELRGEAQVARGVPHFFLRKPGFGRLVGSLAL